MKQLILFIVLLVATISASSSWTREEGVVVFNVKKFPEKIGKSKETLRQEIMLLGCNTKKSVEVEWQEDGQNFDIPYGTVNFGTEREYFVSKYYLASPPVKKNFKSILGKLSPDNFVFQSGEEKPKQYIDVNYSVLPPVSLVEINADFDHRSRPAEKTCAEQKVNLVPINIVCPNFPQISGRKGASGIGYLENQPGFDKIFVPKTGIELSNVLNCSATILDEIILEHEIFFDTTLRRSKTVNMKKLYDNNESMKFVCVKRRPDNPPEGCREPGVITKTISKKYDAPKK